MGERRGVYRVLLGKPEGKNPLGRPRHRFEDSNNNKIDFQRVGWDMEWIELARDKGQVAGTCECGNEPSGSICGEFLDYLRTD